jgi:hypothetical protein
MIDNKALLELIEKLREEAARPEKVYEAFGKEMQRRAAQVPGKAQVSAGSYPGEMVITVPATQVARVTQ